MPPSESQVLTPQEAVLRRLFDAVERRDGPAVLACYDPQVSIHEAPSLPYGGDYSGMDGAIRHGLGYRQTWDAHQTGIERRLDPHFVSAGDVAVVLWHQRARHAQTGQEIDLPAVSFYRLNADGRIVESRMFHFDTVRLLSFLRQPDPPDEDR
jgi:ketosteroid isomerase-like protein